jgi:hypothetical protein
MFSVIEEIADQDLARNSIRGRSDRAERHVQFYEWCEPFCECCEPCSGTVIPALKGSSGGLCTPKEYKQTATDSPSLKSPTTLVAFS